LIWFESPIAIHALSKRTLSKQRALQHDISDSNRYSMGRIRKAAPLRFSLLIQTAIVAKNISIVLILPVELVASIKPILPMFPIRHQDVSARHRAISTI